jgi:hypothetical protein
MRGRSQRRGATIAVGATVFTLMAFFSLSLLAAILNVENDRRLEGPFDVESREMFDFVSNSTRELDVIVFFRPRIMTFTTERKAILVNDCGQLTRGDYYVYHEQLDRHNQIPLDVLYGCPDTVEIWPVFNNPKFRVFRIREAESTGSTVESG